MRPAVEIHTRLGIEEIVMDIDVEDVPVGNVVIVHHVLVVVAVRLVVHVAVLKVAEYAPGLRQGEGSLHEGASIQLGSVGIVVFQRIVGRDAVLGRDRRIRSVGQETEMVALELLHRKAAHHVPGVLLPGKVGYDAVSVLAEAFAADEIGLLDLVAIRILEVFQAVFDQLVMVAEFLVIAISAGVVRRDGKFPAVVYVPGEVQDMVGLPEIVGGARPQGAFGHAIALYEIAPVIIVQDGIVLRAREHLIKGVEETQAGIAHILVGLYAVIGIQAVVVIAAGDAVPRLAGVLEIAEQLVGQLPAGSEPAQAAEIAPGTPRSAVQVAVGSGLMVSPFEHEMAQEQAAGQASAPVGGVV